MDEDEIVGLLKFSDYDYSDGISHFQQLKNGKVYFNNPNFFSNYGNDAQKAIEGTTDSIKFAKEKKSEAKLIIGRYGATDIIDAPVGLNYKNTLERSKSIIGYDINSVIHEDFEGVISDKKQKYDILLVPQEYNKAHSILEKPIYVLNEKNFIIEHNLEKAKILFCNDDRHSTWRIASFVCITRSNLDRSGKIKKDLIDGLINGNSKRNGIAIIGNDLKQIRPWVLIPFELIVQGLSNYKEIKKGIVKYYSLNEYPYSINDILVDPNKLLLAKDNTYKEQNEYRLIVGGPNEKFKNELPPLINFGWSERQILSGSTSESLYELRF